MFPSNYLSGDLFSSGRKPNLKSLKTSRVNIVPDSEKDGHYDVFSSRYIKQKSRFNKMRFNQSSVQEQAEGEELLNKIYATFEEIP